MKLLLYSIKNCMIDYREIIQMFFFSCVIGFMIVFFKGNIEIIEREIHLFDKMDGVYFYSNNRKEDDIDIEKIIGKDNAVVHQVKTNAIKCGEIYSMAYIYDHYLMSKMNYSYCEGTGISNRDEIVISKTLAEKYSVGDTIKIEYYNKAGEKKTVSKFICGVLKDDGVISGLGTGDIDYSVLISEEEKLFILTCDPNLIDPFEMIYQTIFLEVKDTSAVNKIKYNTLNYGEVYSYEQLKKANEEILKYEIGQKMIFVVVVIVLVFSVYMGSIYLTLVRRKKEMAIMMLIGASFMESVIAIRSAGGLAILLGSAIGELIAVFAIKMEYLEGTIEASAILTTWAEILGLYIVCCIVIHSIYEKRNIRDFLRG